MYTLIYDITGVIPTTSDTISNTCTCLCREQQLEQREQASQAMQTEAVALKAELQTLSGTLRTQAQQQAADSAEEKQSAARQQARLDTLQVCCARVLLLQLAYSMMQAALFLAYADVCE